MDIVGKDFRLDGGGYCTICEGSIDHPREKAIDTKRDLHLFAGPHPLEGRKYICESCAREIAVVSGYIKEERAAALSEAEVEANTKLTAELLKLMPLIERATHKEEDNSAGREEVSTEGGGEEVGRVKVRRAKVESNS